MKGFDHDYRLFWLSHQGRQHRKGLAAILEATGRDYEIVRLSELDMRICRACKSCVASNRCVIGDDVNFLLGEIPTKPPSLKGRYPERW